MLTGSKPAIIYTKTTTAATDPGDLFMQEHDPDTQTWSSPVKLYDHDAVDGDPFVAFGEFVEEGNGYAYVTVNNMGALETTVVPLLDGAPQATLTLAGFLPAFGASTDGALLIVMTDPADNTRVVSHRFDPGTGAWATAVVMDTTEVVSVVSTEALRPVHPSGIERLPFDFEGFDGAMVGVTLADGTAWAAEFNTASGMWTSTQVFGPGTASASAAVGLQLSLDFSPSTPAKYHGFALQDDGAGGGIINHRAFVEGSGWTTPTRVDDPATTGMPYLGAVTFSNMFGFGGGQGAALTREGRPAQPWWVHCMTPAARPLLITWCLPQTWWRNASSLTSRVMRWWWWCAMTRVCSFLNPGARTAWACGAAPSHWV